MKKFFFVAVISLFSVAAFAQEDIKNSGENFAARKQQMTANLNAQKATIDQAISCVNSAQNGQDLRKCHEAREQSIRQLQQNNVVQRKAELQNQINKLDAKEQELKNKPLKADKK